MWEKIIKDMKKEMAMKTTYSGPMLVFKTNITKGTGSLCLKCNICSFFLKNGAFLHSIEINEFFFHFLHQEMATLHTGGKCGRKQSRI